MTPRFNQYRSFKWVVGLLFMLAALFVYLGNHVGFFEAAVLFGIGVILL